MTPEQAEFLRWLATDLMLVGIAGGIGYIAGRLYTAARRRRGTGRPTGQESPSDRLLWLPGGYSTPERFARVDVQRVMHIHAITRGPTAHRAVCWHHGTDSSGLIPKWMGETHLIEPGRASWLAAEADARAHDRAEH